MADDPMWSLVMFDLPVLTAIQRREATRFRKLLLDVGYSMMQLSVYVRYIPTGGQSHATLRRLKSELPAGGEVRIFHITDRQWSTALRFDKGSPETPEEEPTQLVFF